jgi:hypothetical protein
MKKKSYIRVSILFFVFSVAVALYSLSLTGLFDNNKIMVRALACDSCASYEVVMGSFKLSGHAFDTIQNKNITQAFLNGAVNPDVSDYTKTYDYYIVTGTVTGVKQVNTSEPWNPVFTVTAWEHVDLVLAWPFVLGIIILLTISLRYHRRFIKANKKSMEKSLLTHEEPIE